jgi:hypothetical protein
MPRLDARDKYYELIDQGISEDLIKRIPLKLSTKHYKFLDAYIRLREKNKAMLEAGYNGSSASTRIRTATAILLNEEAKKYVRKAYEIQQEQCFLTKDRLIQEIYDLIPEMKTKNRYTNIMEAYNQISKLLGFDITKQEVSITGGKIKFEFGNDDLLNDKNDAE